MTCQALASQDVYKRQEAVLDVFTLREDGTPSINNLRSTDCAAWSSTHTNCGITYADEEQDADYDLRKGQTVNEDYGIFDE